MTVRMKLSALIILSILLAGFLFGINWYASYKKKVYDDGLLDFNSIRQNLLNAIIEEKKFLADHLDTYVSEVHKYLDISMDLLDRHQQNKLFNTQEMSELKNTFQNYHDSFQNMVEIIGNVDTVNGQLNNDINQFNHKSIAIIEKVDAAVGKAFMTGEEVDANLQSLSDVTRTAILLMTKISLSLSQDLFIKNDSEGFLKKSQTVLTELKAAKNNFTTFHQRLKVNDPEYSTFIQDTHRVIDALPELIDQISKLWPEKVIIQSKLDQIRDQMLNRLEIFFISTINQVNTISRQFWIASIVAFLFIVLSLLVGGISILLSILRPINKVIDSMKDIAEGKGDLTRRIDILNQDEIGELAKWFNVFVDKLRVTITTIATDIGKLNISSDHLKTIASDMSVKASQMQDRSKDASQATQQTSSNIGSIATAAEEVSTQVALVAESNHKLSERIHDVGELAENVSSAVNMVATSIEEMYASLNEVSQNSVRCASVTNDASRKANDTSSIVNKLGEAAKEIGAVVDLIKGIAAQTNLLALNATIEAAGAGDAGKGFAVVANEVKELARQTAGATEEIREKVEGMQSNTAIAITAINTIVQVINEINSIMNTIASAVEEQTVTTNEITKSVSETATSANSVSDNVKTVIELESEISVNMTQVSLAAHNIASDSSQASLATHRVLENVSGVNMAAELTSKSVTEVSAQANDLSTIAIQLQKVVGQFKIQ
ncbi:MAG: methyl-accepting chemotaxis protein [Desulfobacterales bacterium]|nr:methyl-accepting chemotaxis protein [Desulfobacterales bacterium]